MRPPSDWKNVMNRLPAGMLPGATAGLVAGFTRLNPAWAPAQIPALALLGWSLARSAGTTGRLRPGFWFGASMAAIVLMNVGVPGPAAGILFVALSGYWMLMGAGLSRLIRRDGITGILGAAGLLTLGEWAQSEALPMFGTAQRLASAWVDYDAALTPARLGGTTLITFLVGTTAFSLSKCFPATNTDDTYRVVFTTRPLIPGIGVVILLHAAVFALGADQRVETPRSVTLAVCGAKSGAFQDERDFLKTYRPMLERAAAGGATLAVTPEMGLFVSDSARDATLARLAKEAEKLGLAWVVGYAQAGPSLNRAQILNLDGSGSVGLPYDKTHWVPYAENYARHGDGAAVTGVIPGGVKIGLMICQDDNYEDVARNLSRSGVQIAAVPTFDWRGVEHAHLHSARNRPREFGFIEARAAVGGVSAIIDSTGCVVASMNHLTDGDGVVVATVAPPAGGPTPFARFGNLALLATSGACVVAALRPRRAA